MSHIKINYQNTGIVQSDILTYSKQVEDIHNMMKKKNF